MKRSIDDPAGYLERLRPIYVQLFRVAHAIVGNLELSEYVLRSAIVEAYLRRGEWQGRMGFQESLMHTVRTVALVELKGMRAAGAFETDWSFPKPTLEGDSVGQMIMQRLLREPEVMARIALLHYGADLNVRQIAAVMHMRVNDVGARLRRLDSRLKRVIRLKGGRGERALYEYMEDLCHAALSLPGDDVAEMGAVFRSFERDVYGAKKPRVSVGRVVGAAVKVLCALVLAAVVWLVAVLLEPRVTRVAEPAPVEAQIDGASNLTSAI